LERLFARFDASAILLSEDLRFPQIVVGVDVGSRFGFARRASLFLTRGCNDVLFFWLVLSA
jgi:hypothetical protein